MVNLGLKRKLAARVMDVGIDRIWFDPDRLEDLEGVDTREDVKALVEQGVIKVLKKRGQTRRKPTARKGPGRRKGKKTTSMSKKELWMRRVRAQRRMLRGLREKGTISPSQYRALYGRVKGGMFRTKAHLFDHIKTKTLKGEAR